MKTRSLTPIEMDEVRYAEPAENQITRPSFGVVNGESHAQPLKALENEIKALRQDLRRASKVYLARLEIGLAQSAAVIASYHRDRELKPEKLRHIRDLTILLRSRNPSAGDNGRKELRIIDGLIQELHLATHGQV